MKIGIIGTGAYGLSLAIAFSENNCDITMWTKNDKEYEKLKNDRKNEKKLPGIIMPKDIKYTTNMGVAVKDKQIIVIAVPATFVDDVSKELNKYITKDQHICIATKGIENDTCLFIEDVIRKYIKTTKIAVISGPSFAVDLARKVPIGLALGSKNRTTKALIKKAISNSYLKVRPTNDVLGIEICGSIKNVMAIAAGMLDGMGLPESTQAMFITESLHDIKELIRGLGGRGKTILTYAGFGDLLLTCTSVKSRNFSFGRLIGSNAPREEIEEYIKNTTIEGLYTLKSIHKLVNKKRVEIPIIDLIYNIVFNNYDPSNLVTFLVEKK